MKTLTLKSIVAAGVIAGLVVPVAALADTQFLGAGATFPYPFFSRAFYAYSQEHAGITVNYASIGSGGGISQFTAKTVDFGASDVPMTKAEIDAAVAANGAVVQLPDTLGGIAIAYNVPGAPKHIKLQSKTLADIFLGKVTNWNDPEIASVNPGVKLPALAILVAHRADASGTSYHFTDYLSKVSPDWKSKVGAGKSVNWPTGVGAKGNEGVAGQLSNTPGAIGYIELAYALQNDISYVALQNKDGNYVLPSIDSIRAAASQKPEVSATDFSITDMSGKDSYPIAGYSWILVWKNQADPARGKQLTDMLKWLVTGGQQYAEKVNYVPLPDNVQQVALKAIGSIHN
ncbi:MAG TPA: phosphate ABC transporter substrate-binding protein PstS [Candidatus Eremiobacteraceae bacterium]|nr:phosphate ABC transporter substrate-binding protein PstS [Candidatus Eremiobacteraceae bacterium]